MSKTVGFKVLRKVSLNHALEGSHIYEVGDFVGVTEATPVQFLQSLTAQGFLEELLDVDSDSKLKVPSPEVAEESVPEVEDSNPEVAESAPEVEDDPIPEDTEGFVPGPVEDPSAGFVPLTQDQLKELSTKKERRAYLKNVHGFEDNAISNTALLEIIIEKDKAKAGSNL